MERQIIRPNLLLIVLLITVTLASQTVYSSDCPKPERLNIPVPETGFHWLAGEEFTGICDRVTASQWHVHQSNGMPLWEANNDPSGSGRYWRISIGLSNNPASQPEKGFCLYTSTVGWRTLQQYERLPLPWIIDLDRDGQLEFLLWSSFPLSEEPTTADFGLIVWVYKLINNENFVLDWDLTEKMALELAKSYRQSLKTPGIGLSKQRKTAEEKLNTLASGACSNTTVRNYK